MFTMPITSIAATSAERSAPPPRPKTKILADVAAACLTAPMKAIYQAPADWSAGQVAGSAVAKFSEEAAKVAPLFLNPANPNFPTELSAEWATQVEAAIAVCVESGVPVVVEAVKLAAHFIHKAHA
jgi:hypothetical protein